ncbi:hypothetical protein RRF57_008679 [Xylaria bambusicola]|uniref:Uncharacterized protein n=1 Tax=Xylaria bambusicola TaxID=326684 RepID=A0AAN7UIA2_9PEZI
MAGVEMGTGQQRRQQQCQEPAPLNRTEGAVAQCNVGADSQTPLIRNRGNWTSPCTELYQH